MESDSVSLSTGSSSKIIVFSNGFSSTYVTEGTQISFTLQHLQNPTDNDTTGSFAFATFDEAGYAIETLSTGLTVSAQSGELSEIIFRPIESQRGVYMYSSDIDLQFTTGNDFPNTGEIVLDFSGENAGFSLVSDQKCTVTSTNSNVEVSSSVECQIYASQQKITISSLSSSNISRNTQVYL